MVKTNYNRSEDALNKGLEKMKIDALLKEADRASSSDKHENVRELSAKQMMILVRQNLKLLEKQDQKIYETLGTTKKRVTSLFKQTQEATSPLDATELAEIKALKEKVDGLREKYAEKPDEEVLKAEIERHIHKRHNVREQWIPLDTHSDWDKFKNSPKKER